MEIQDKRIKFYKQNNVYINFCDLSQQCYQHQIKYYQILILQIYSHRAIILVNDIFLVTSLIYKQKNFHYKVKTMNQAQLLELFQIVVLYRLLLILLIKMEFCQFVVGVYYLINLLDENLIQPILMQGSINTTNPNYAMIINKNTVNGPTNNIFFYFEIEFYFNQKTFQFLNYIKMELHYTLHQLYLEYHMYFKQPHIA
ncbi:unnamed protein product [Paramecium pentaurelia]|uniref:Uncharacterized protein n=1 Tax=Paramecium pentaurelia TaxID=43138 RepID=A0A8S1YL36_9CILI|nr:unnamed protein product [Paramecium pentaurelia]